MKFGKALAVSAAALTIGIATPALAQSGVTEGGNGSADNNTTVDDTANDFLDLLSNNGNGNNRDNDDNGDNRDNDDNGNNRDNDDNGNNRDNETENYGDGSASRGGEVEDNGDNRDNDDNGNNRDNDQSDDDGIDDSLNGSLNGNGNNRDNQDNDGNGNNRDNGDSVVGVQVLTAVITNNGMDEVIDIDTDQNGHTVSTGDAYIRGNAFAAFAGINSQAFNTGQNANVQSATNIAASGTVNFGSAPE